MLYCGNGRSLTEMKVFSSKLNRMRLHVGLIFCYKNVFLDHLAKTTILDQIPLILHSGEPRFSRLTRAEQVTGILSPVSPPHLTVSLYILLLICEGTTSPQRGTLKTWFLVGKWRELEGTDGNWWELTGTDWNVVLGSLQMNPAIVAFVKHQK